MTALLTIAAVIALLSLVMSATGALSKATPPDPQPRGSWGIARYTSIRNAPLSSHERRWQTRLLSGKDSESRWRTLVMEIESLEHLAHVTRDEAAPATFDRAWVADALAGLESAMEEKNQPGDSS